MELLIFIVFGFVLMWIFVVLPQRRRQSAHESMIASLQPGDEVVTAGGIYGDVTEIGEDEVALEIAPGVEVRVATRAIGAVIPPDSYEDEEDVDVAGESDVEPVDPAAAEGAGALRGAEPAEADTGRR